MSDHTFKHAEAFCLMTYRADDGTEEEVIWNSRDGVTPFVITLRSGKTATHVAWQKDRCDPGYRPPLGSRIFADLGRDKAAAAARQRVEAYPEYLYGNDPEEVIAMLAEDFYGDGHSPTLEVVAG
jgi:hypothetical protein